MALQNVQRIQIELDGSAPFEYVVAKAGEKESRIVEVTLLENKKEFTVPAGTTAKIKYYKPDGKFVLNNATRKKEKKTRQCVRDCRHFCGSKS